MRHRDLTSPKSWPPRSTTAPKRSLTDLAHPPRHPRPVVIAHPAGAHVGQLMRASADSSRITISDFLISSEKMTLASAMLDRAGRQRLCIVRCCRCALSFTASASVDTLG